MISIVRILLSPRGRLGMALAGIVAFLVAFGSDQRSRAVAKIEKATTNAVNKGKSAGSKSVSGDGRMLDPYTIDDSKRP